MIMIIIFIIGFLLGSFPTAYLIVKKIKKLDITENGSGNVGALNSFKVSSSKLIGISVLLIDILKGIASVIIAKNFFPDNFLVVCLTLTFSVLGHCYSPWIKFKGGKGLATAAGGAIFLAPIILIIWILLWLIAYFYRKSVQLANIAATFLTMLVSISSADIISKSRWLTNPEADNSLNFIFPIATMLLIILSKHINSIKEYISNWSRSNR